MADDSSKDDQEKPEEDFGALTNDSDSDEGFGTGSLPPLSDFDSAEGDSGMDSDLPPLDTPESDGTEDDEDAFSGLPPIVDIRVDTPAVRPSDLDTPEPSRADKNTVESPSPAGFDTPSDAELESPSDGGFGFQDFAADSDFSPETPEIGPGPDSDIETPMFDSAFGGDSDDFSTGGSSPTQAMETPMFGDEGGGGGGGLGFDNDAFGAATPDFAADAGTPVPDFSPDTGADVAPDTGGMTPIAASPPPKRGSRLVGMLITVVLVAVGIAGGMFLGAKMVGTISFLPNNFAGELDTKDARITKLEEALRNATQTDPGGPAITPEEIARLRADVDDLNTQLNVLNGQTLSKQEEIDTLKNKLVVIKADIEDRNNEFVEAQEALEDLRNETAITDARHKGLLAENERLTDMVGQLEVANARRQATKDTLLHNVDLLIIQIQGGSPLTPERYDYDQRLARVNALRDKIARAKWADPQVLDEYTSLYLAELAIGSSREYFYARIPTTDKLGNVDYSWAECLMNGNWSVYFHTIDGKTIGSFENAAGSGPPRYEFREDLPSGMRSDIVEAIEAARPEDWKDKFKVLRDKQAIYETRSALQEKFSSLR